MSSNPMRTTKNISVTFPTAMAKDAERLAKRENRTMSELMREAFRYYRNGGKKRVPADLAAILQIIAEVKANPLPAKALAAEDARLMKFGATQAKKVGSKESDAVRVVHENRARRAAS